MNRNIVRIIVLFAIIMIFIFIGTVEARVVSTDPIVQPGGEISITLTTTEPAYAYKITLVDEGGLTFQSATSTSGQVNGKVANGASTTGVKTLATYKLKAPTVSATTKYSVKFNVSISTDGETYTDTTNTSTVTVKVPEPSPSPVPKSNDATLKSITVGGKKYTGSALNSTISQTVESQTNSISISAEVNNSKAKVSGTGTKSLIAGQTNAFTVTVTAEDGSKKTYKVNVIRKAVENTEPNIIEDNKEEEQNEELQLTTLIIKDVELNTEFKPDVLNYIANVKNMKELEIDAKANKENAEIKIEGAKDLKEGDNTILITVVLGEENVQYKINLYNKIEEEDIIVNKEPETPSKKQSEFTIDEIKNVILENWLVISLLIIIFILAIFSITLAFSTYKYSKEVIELTGEEDEIIERDEEKNEKIYDDIVQKRNKQPGKHF